ncbi:MAG: NADH-quinone oxidoreductase subunit L [Tistlia sp.]|uniref:NADH-quinone oxidoreductase subunit L n=1 Tax=Tistlia sp. TaxID=3057121 RepID=UPI0034A238CF
MDVLIVFLPLVGAILAGFLGKLLGDRGCQVVTAGLLSLAALLSVVVFFDVALGGNARTTQLFTWIDSGAFELNWALRVDTLTAVMFCVVTVVSAVVHVYSVGYMAEDRSIPRFMAYLSLFTFFMLMLVSSDNLVQMFFGWEGVGLASYLLIGFWYEKPSANAAAIKAFLVNRVGDVGFALGIAGLFLLFGAVDYDPIFRAAPGEAETVLRLFGFELHALTVICLLLFLGAMGKSAQLGLHTWLPDAMEGPTPVSALIHAATMVTAGVFMVCRLSPVFEYAPDALTVVTIVGASTAFFAATVGLTQTDIKRVIAYSTCSQLGYMFFAAGVSAYGAAMFHLMTHAFFKALLFLGAGAVIHALHHEQDMRKMGGLWRKIPVTYALMWIGTLALVGFGIPGLGIGFAGFYSKDMVLEAAYAAHSAAGGYAFWLGIAAAFMTAFYSFRLLFLTFHGPTRADHHAYEQAHEAPRVMIWPLFLLAAGAVLAGALLYGPFVGEGREAFWGGSLLALEDIIEEAHHVPFWVKALPMVVTLGGIALAWLMYLRRPELAPRMAERFRPLYLFSFHKWYFDELYDRTLVQPALRLGRGFWTTGDGRVIDGLGPDGIAATARVLARRASLLQSGYVYHYAFVMLIGVVVLVTWYLFSTL